MKAASSQPDATMSDIASQSQQEVEIGEPVTVALNNAKDDTVEKADDKESKPVLTHKFSEDCFVATKIVVRIEQITEVLRLLRSIN